MFAVVAATITPLLFFGVWLANVEYERTRTASIGQLMNVSRALLQAVEREFQHREGTLLALAATPALLAGDLAEFFKISQTIVARMPATSGIILADESGQQIINTRRPFGTQLPRRGDMTPVKKVFETKKTWVSDLFMGALMNIPVVGIDIPVFRGEKVEYNLALSVPIEELDRILARQQFPDGWIAVIADRSGTIVSRSVDTKKWIGKKIAALAPSDPASAAREGYLETTTNEGIEVVTAWSRSPEWGWAVAISQPVQQLRADLIPNLSILFFSGVLASMLGVFLASLVSRRILAATSGLASSAVEIGTSDYQQQETTGISEIDSVSARLTEASLLLRERALQRNSAEEHQRMLMAELDHRVKNILASVQALARQTLGRTPEAESLGGRIMALAQAHNMLATSRWRGAELRELVETILSAHRGDADRFAIDGPNVILDPKSTQALSLVLHELSVNATKYGALSRSDGRLAVSWRVEGGRLILTWTERSGPEVKSPTAKGFGSKLIELSVSELGGTLQRDFDATGFSCRIDIPIGKSDYRFGPLDYDATPDRPAKARWSSLAGKRILLVEDSALIGEDLVDLLRKADARVIGPAVSVAAAIDQLNRTEPDGAILDVNLSGELVFPVADLLHARNIPFFFITGYGDPYVWPVHLRAVQRLMKPVHSDDVLNLLAVLLANGSESGKIADSAAANGSNP